MDIKKMQTVGLALGLALFVATGLLALTAAERPAPRPTTDSDSSAEWRPVSESRMVSSHPIGESFADVATAIKPCVVTVYSQKTVSMPRSQWPFDGDSPFRWFFGGPDESSPQPRRAPQRNNEFKQSGTGSGVIIDKEGHILTNNHVVQDMDAIKVKLSDDGEFDATVVGTDPSTDLAVIQIKGKVPRDLAAAPLGDSDALRVGDWVLAVGAPFGYEQTVTSGIISAKGRKGVENNRDKYEDFLQTDAAINPGNSGGPLVNLKGEVVGINSAIATRIGQFAGVGFAIPINMAKPVIRDLIKSGHVTRGLLGIAIQPITSDLAEQFGLSSNKGALVGQVNKGSPAEKAGIKAGDAAVEFNGTAIENTDHLRNLVAATAPGTKVDLIVVRNGKRQTLTASVGELKSDEKASAGKDGETNSDASDLGFDVTPLTPRAARQYGYDPEATGLLVTGVENGSPAAEAGLREGDLITEINHQPLANVSQLRDAVTKAKGGKSILIFINRQGTSLFVIVKPK